MCFMVMDQLEVSANRIRPDNASGIRKIAWTREFRDSRVFCYASGHDNAVYADENFRKIMHQAIRWSVEGR